MTDLDIKTILAAVQIFGSAIFTVGGGFVVNYLRSISRTNEAMQVQQGRFLEKLVSHEKEIGSLDRRVTRLEDRGR